MEENDEINLMKMHLQYIGKNLKNGYSALSLLKVIENDRFTDPSKGKRWDRPQERRYSSVTASGMMFRRGEDSTSSLIFSRSGQSRRCSVSTKPTNTSSMLSL